LQFRPQPQNKSWCETARDRALASVQRLLQRSHLKFLAMGGKNGARFAPNIKKMGCFPGWLRTHAR
jgi:hypothetical protein